MKILIAIIKMENFIEQKINKSWDYIVNQQLEKDEELCSELKLLYNEQEYREKI